MQCLKVSMVVVAGLVSSSSFAETTVRLSTDDGKALVATSYGTGDKGVLLVHDRQRSSADWDHFATRLSQNGFRVLALDLRGHGRSRAAADPIGETDWLNMVDDIDAGTAWLRRQGATVTAVGASLGANLVLNAAADNADISSIVMLSPGLNIEGVKVSGAIGRYDRPVLFVADSGDLTSAKAATLLEAKALGEKRLELLDANASGHKMLNTAPALESTLVGWLNGAYGGAEGTSARHRDLEAGAVEDIATTGTKYEDR